MLVLVIEHFHNGDAAPVYGRLREQGRLALDGPTYVTSWVTRDLTRCYQVMECDDRVLWTSGSHDGKTWKSLELCPSCARQTRQHASLVRAPDRTERNSAMRWETRYSSAEMGYLEIIEPKREVVFYLNYPRNVDDRWSFDDFLAGKADYVLNSVYGSEVVDEVKAEIRRRL